MTAEKNSPDQPKKTVPTLQRRRLSRRLVATALILVAVLGIGLFVARLFSQPVHGHSEHTSLSEQAAKAHKAPAETPAPQPVQNNYFSLALPSGYQIQANNQTPAGLLYQQTIIKPASFGSTVISVALKTQPDGGALADSSYQLRSQQATRYHASSRQQGGDELRIFNDTQSASVVVFWPHDGYLATISASTGLGDTPTDNNSDLLKILEPVVSGWQWQ